MVRREDTEPTEGRLTGKAVSRCTAPAGESPVRVIAGEPGSRPAPEVERPDGEAWCRKPSAAKAVHGEQLRGPQHQVKPAASTDSQSGSRAEHFTVKATISARESGWAGSSGGVRGAAREEGAMRNTRDPSVLRRSKPQGGPYKPEAKSGAAQRESEGAVVLVMAAQNNAAGGKGPCFSHAGEKRRREGMTGKTESNHPVEQKLDVKAPDSWDQLRGTAKPILAHAVRGGLSASRVREIRKHGLNGGPVSYCEVHCSL